MKSFHKIFLPLFMVTVLALPLASQQADKKDSENLKKVADDMKFNNGVQFIRLGFDKKAEQEFLEYLEIHINGIHRHEAYQNLATIYFNRFDYQKALKVYRKLYEEFSASDTGVEAYFNAGLCYKKMGYNEKAIFIFREIVKNHPSSVYAKKSRLQVDLLKILNPKK